MDDSRFSRRTLLGATGTAVMAGLAGCSDILPGDGNDDTNGTETPGSNGDDFNFPAGFSDTGLEVSTVFAESGTMASLPSLSAVVEQSVESEQGTQGSVRSGDYDAESQQFVAQVESLGTEQSVPQNYYFEEGTIYIERNFPEQESQYQKDTYEFQRLREYYLNTLKEKLSNVNLNYQGTEQRDGQTVAVYTASTEDFSSDSFFGGELLQQPTFTSLESAEGELTVDSQGYIHTVDFVVDYANNNDGVTTINETYTYGNFGSATVEEPSWVANNEFEDLSVEPTVDVEFSETAGESVTVTVNSIENADVVHIVVNNSLVDQLQEPGSVTVEASTYTVEGQVAPIGVFANREGQQPTEIDTYTPESPASGSGNTTDTSGNTSGS